MPFLKTGRSEEKEVDVVLGDVACAKNEGPPFLCKVRAKNQCTTSPSIAWPHAQVQLLKTGRSEEKEVDGVHGEVACSKTENHLLFAKFTLQPMCNFFNDG